MPLDTFNYDELAHRLQFLKPRTKLYKVIKSALKAKGLWKDKPRGDPAKGKRLQGKNEEAH